MIVLLNGSFGVGKTTVGRILRRRIAGSVLYNPEWAGSLLMRLPIKFKGSGTDDFQDIDLWRRSVVGGIRIFRLVARETVIVPMAFYRRDYIEEVIGGIRKVDDHVRIFCLQANLEKITERLAMRGERTEDGNSNWSIRKARECIKAHENANFGEAVNTNQLSANEVADEILERLNINSR